MSIWNTYIYKIYYHTYAQVSECGNFNWAYTEQNDWLTHKVLTSYQKVTVNMQIYKGWILHRYKKQKDSWQK